MTSQTIVWTMLPRGLNDGRLWLSVLVSPRLSADADTTLDTFPDFTNWPGKAIDLQVEVGGQIAANPTRIDDVRDPALWQALFPSGTGTDTDTLVRAFKLSDHSKDTCSSYALDEVVNFLATQYGKFAVDFPEEYPTWEALIGDDAFGCLGFSKRGDIGEQGPVRRTRLLESLRDDLALNRFIPRSSARADPCNELGRRFLELEQFHEPAGKVPSTRPPNRDYDFHEVITLLLSHPELLRRLGLVIDLVADLPDPLPDPPEPVKVRVVPTWESALGAANVTPFTQCRVGAAQFFALPRGADPDFAGGHFKLGRTDMFATAVADPDGGALKAMALADAIQISREFTGDSSGNKHTLTTPDRYALPSLRTGGIQVSRIELAGLLIGGFDTGSGLLKGIDLAVDAQQANPEAPPTGPDLYAEDLVRARRWDVYDEISGDWRSLMDRRVTYKVTDGPEVVIEHDQAAAIVAPTKASDTAPDAPASLKMSEALVRWDGWSLAVPRLGQTINEADELEDKTKDEKHNPPEANIPLSIRPVLPPGVLPRLRFGRTYRLRARTVDLGGNSVPFDQGVTIEATELVTPSIRYGRFEPVPHPPVLLRFKRGEGESPELAAIRSEGPSSSLSDVTPAERHVVPPDTSAHMAERHGRFDLASPGKPLDTSAYTTLGGGDGIMKRDESSLFNHPDAKPELGQSSPSVTYPDTDQLTVTWLPDPFARGALLRGLPPGSVDGSKDVQVPFDGGLADEAWPTYEAFRLKLEGHDISKWDLSGPLLTVSLDKGDVFRVRLSSHLTGSDVNKMALLEWVERWVASLPISADEKVERVRGFQQLATEGRCYMITPYRELSLVHAVRTPLIAPTVTPQVQRDFGATFAQLSNKPHNGDADTFSRKSTSTIDIVGSWAMPVDNGIDEDPVTPHQFEALAFTLRQERANDPEPDNYIFDERHEFGDTKYRLVNYRATATSAFTEFFVDHTEDPLTLSKDQATKITDGPVEPTTVKVRNHDDPKQVYRQGTDYIVDGPDGTVTSLMDTTVTVDVDFVASEIHATGPEAPPLDVPNSAPPAAANVLYVVPTFEWDHPNPRFGNVRTQRKGGGLRVYMERPWWSSGDGERLAVLFDPNPDPNEAPDPSLAPYITLFGFDPAYGSKSAAPLLPIKFPRRIVAEEGIYGLQERPEISVAVAPHGVAYDKERGLWFCDIQIDDPSGSYQPMVRLALARFQYHSLIRSFNLDGEVIRPGTHLSPVVLADFIQLSPTRTATLVRRPPTGSPFTVPYDITVRGTSYLATEAAAGPATMLATVERHRDDLTDDPDLGWEAVGQPTVLSRSFPDPFVSTNAQWTGQVKRPLFPPGRRYRLVLEELEVHFTGNEISVVPGQTPPPAGRRLVHTDVIPLV